MTDDVREPQVRHFSLLSDPRQVSDAMDIPFTEEQLDAIGAPLEPQVIIAGAGSGKTAVMAARVVWLVGSGQVAPDEVLGLTFTNKAAAELGDRIAQALSRIRLEVPDDALEAPGEPTVSTYHAYAARLLSEQGLRLGVEPDARLLSAALRYQLAQRVLRRAPGPFPHFEQGIAWMTGLLLALDGELNEHLVSTEAARAHDRMVLRQMDQVTKPVKDVQKAATTARARLDLLDLVDTFRAQKRTLSVIDFGDQLAFAAQLVREHPDVVQTERERYRVVLLDEYQDTSVAQKRLLLDLFGDGHPVTAVGDPFQAIYGWRGASVRNILRFPQEFVRSDGEPARRIGLTQNNRSMERVLDTANVLSAPLRAQESAVGALVPRQDHRGGGDVGIGVFDTAEDEFDWGIDFVCDRVRDGIAPKDIAVLSRTTRGIPLWYSALIARGVPVEVVGLGGLLALPEIVDLVSLLELLDDPTANPSVMRVLTGPRFRIGPSDLRALGRRAKELVQARHGMSDGDAMSDDERLNAALADAVAESDVAEVASLVDAVTDPGRHTPLSAEARERLAALAREIDDLRRLMALPLADLVAVTIERSGISLEVAVRDGAQQRSESLAAFMQAVTDFVDLDGDVTLRGFLAYLAVERDDDRGLGGAAPSGANAVRLMTMHASKGLEFPIVVIPDATKGTFPSEQGGTTWLSNAGTLPYPLRGDADDYPVISEWSKKAIDVFKDEAKTIRLTEERRLAYVAVTRAERQVVLTSHWWGRTQKGVRGPSPFLVSVHDDVDRALRHVIAWSPKPEDGIENPLLANAAIASWPEEINVDHQRRRVAAAALVRQHRTALDSGGHDVAPALDGMSRLERSRVTGWQRDAAVLSEELERMHAPVTTVAMPTSLTASAVVDIATDPEAYARRLRRPMPRPPARAAQRGTRFHAWVEARFGQRPLVDVDALGSADGAELVDDEELRELQAAFERGPFADRVPFRVEAPFRIVLAGGVVRGRIDAVYRTDEGYDVIDWKTGTHPADPVQLAIYRLGWAAVAGVDPETVTAGFYVVREGVIDRPELPDREALEQVLRPATP